MSYAKLNIWLRYSDCSLITDCWRTDLVIKTCGGKYVTDMDPSVIEKLKAQYQDYQDVGVYPDYHGETRIRLIPPKGKHINHIEVEIPPGCYIIWTRICHGRNEETNKVMAIVGCGHEACVNLLLNDVKTCSNELLHPILVRGFELKLPKPELAVVAGVLMAVAEKPKKQMLKELGQRLEEVEGRKDPGLQKTINAIKDMVESMPDKRKG